MGDKKAMNQLGFQKINCKKINSVTNEKYKQISERTNQIIQEQQKNNTSFVMNAKNFKAK